MDLGQAWTLRTKKPMVFGGFAARKDTPVEDVQAAQQALLERLSKFEKDSNTRKAVIEWSMTKSELEFDRLNTLPDLTSFRTKARRESYCILWCPVPGAEVQRYRTILQDHTIEPDISR